MKTINGAKIPVRYVAVFNEKQEIIGDALRLSEPAHVEMQLVDDRVGFQLYLPEGLPEIGILVSRPDIVGVALLGEDKEFLCGMSTGDPASRNEESMFILRPRYIIMQPKK